MHFQRFSLFFFQVPWSLPGCGPPFFFTVSQKARLHFSSYLGLFPGSPAPPRSHEPQSPPRPFLGSPSLLTTLAERLATVKAREIGQLTNLGIPKLTPLINIIMMMLVHPTLLPLSSPGPWAKGPGPLGQGARAPGPRSPGPWAKEPGPLGQGARALGQGARDPGQRGPLTESTNK